MSARGIHPHHYPGNPEYDQFNGTIKPDGTARHEPSRGNIRWTTGMSKVTARRKSVAAPTSPVESAGGLL